MAIATPMYWFIMAPKPTFGSCAIYFHQNVCVCVRVKTTFRPSHLGTVDLNQNINQKNITKVKFSASNSCQFEKVLKR